MNDQYGRRIDYMRVSVTDRCNLRCVYCMPGEGFSFFRMKTSFLLKRLKECAGLG